MRRDNRKVEEYCGFTWLDLAVFAALERAQKLTIKCSGALVVGEAPWHKLFIRKYNRGNV